MFDWLTVGVTVPYVKTRAAVQVGFVPSADANLGANPYTAEPAGVNQLLSELDDARGPADQRAETTCSAAAGAGL